MIGKESKQDTSHTIMPCEKKLRKTKVVTVGPGPKIMGYSKFRPVRGASCSRRSHRKHYSGPITIKEKRPLNSSTLATATHKGVIGVSDGTGAQVEA